MTPQERQLVDDLFTRLASVETAPRVTAFDSIRDSPAPMISPALLNSPT